MKTLIQCMALFLVFAISSNARNASSYSSTEENRKNIPFNDGWLFKKGPFAADPILFQAGFEQQWQKVTVPHTWNNIDMQTKRNDFYAGEAYYRKTYNPDVSLKDKRAFLRFEGVAATAEIYVNNTFAGNHQGGYSAFTIEISDLLKYGEDNVILVKVDNSSRQIGRAHV